MSLTDKAGHPASRVCGDLDVSRQRSIVVSLKVAPRILQRLQELLRTSSGSPSISLFETRDGFEIWVNFGSASVSRGAADFMIRFTSISGVPVLPVRGVFPSRGHP